MPKIAVILSGSGVYDGSELHEAVLTLLYLDEAGAEVQCFAPDKPQMHVIDHVKGEPSEGESRNVLVEAARIARGNIKPLSEAKASDFDAIVLPGGYGAAKNLSTFAVEGANCTVDGDLAKLVMDFHNQGKWVAPICIAPAVIAKIFTDAGKQVRVTVGAADDPSAPAVSEMGATHVACTVDEIVLDEANKVISTPAYQLGPWVADVAKGIKKLVDYVVATI